MLQALASLGSRSVRPAKAASSHRAGGGYGYRTNQVGLTIDTIQSYDLVLPNGTITTVTSANDDLFWIMRGGFNTAGIVTSFTLSTQSFTQVWGASVDPLPS